MWNESPTGAAEFAALNSTSKADGGGTTAFSHQLMAQRSRGGGGHPRVSTVAFLSNLISGSLG